MRKRKNRLKGIIRIGILLILALLFVLAIRSLIENRDKSLILGKDTISLYIKAADEASLGKLQVNWKEVAAITSAKYKKHLEKVSYEEMVRISKSFLEINKGENKIKDNKYRIKQAEEVIEEEGFTKKDIEKFHGYLKDLEFQGIAVNNVYKGSPNLEFANSLKEEAIKGYYQYNILPSITIAQAILESGWGKSELTIKGNNLFGIKADSSWKGNKISMKTSEYYNKTITDYFRVYDSIEASLKDHREFLYKNPRYSQGGVFNGKHYSEQAEALEKSGYSTVQNKKGEYIYGDLLKNIIKENNLQLIDNEAQRLLLTNKKQ